MSASLRSRQVLLVAASASVLVVFAGLSRRAAPPVAPSGAPPAAAPAFSLSPLPSGAARVPARALDDGGGCSFIDRGFGVYERWRPMKLGRLLVPAGVDAAAFDLLIHFHGAEPVRKMLAPELDRLVIVGIDAGTLSSDYEEAVRDREALDEIVAAVGREVAVTASAKEAKLRGLALSSWSAGYGAVGSLLARARSRPGAVVLIDSLHASWADRGGIAEESLRPFVEAATRAVEGRSLFFLTHSDVQTEGYASTTAVAKWLTVRVGGSDQGLFLVRSAPGGDRKAHCDQLRLLPDAVQRHVLPVLARPMDL